MTSILFIMGAVTSVDINSEHTYVSRQSIIVNDRGDVQSTLGATDINSSGNRQSIIRGTNSH